MKKRFKLGKVVMATAVATSVFAVSNPVDAANLSTAEKAVEKAEKLAGALKWEISIEHRKAKYPTNLVGMPNMKLHNDTKDALAAAKKVISTLKGKEKEVLQARLDSNVSTYLNRSVAYIDAVSSGLKIQKKYQELKVKFDKGEVDVQTEKLYHEVSREIKKNAFMLDRVYGVTTRAEFRAFYKKTAENQLNELLYPVSIKMDIDRAEQALKDSKLDLAATYLGNVNFFMKEAEKKGQKEDSQIIQGSLAELEAVQKEFNKTAVLYVAGSTNAEAPSVFGPATGSEAVTKTVYLYAGNNEHIKLQNVSIDGNVVVLGTPKGAGTVYLENVKVNKVGTVGGSIIVENIADHSLHMKGVQAESIVVNDADGSNIVAEEGVKVKDVVVSDKAGAKGAVSLESKEKGSFGSITVASKGSENSQGVALKGNLSETTVTVTGEGAKIGVEKGATVKEINIKAASTINVAEGSTVDKVKKDPSVTGPVALDNKGTVKEADEGIKFDNNKPVVVVPPTAVTPPAGGGGGAGSGTIITPVLSSFAATLGNGTEVAGNINLNKIELGTTEDSAIFTGVRISTTNASKLIITSFTANGIVTNFEDNPLQYNLTDTTTISTKDLFGPLDTGTLGIKMENLRAAFFDQGILLKGKLVSSNNIASSDIIIEIDLGQDAPVTSFSNEYGTITKLGKIDNKHTIEVSINPLKSGESISSIQGNISFSRLLLSFAASGVALDPNVIPVNLEQIEALLSNKTLGDLVGFGEFTTNNFKVIFK